MPHARRHSTAFNLEQLESRLVMSGNPLLLTGRVYLDNDMDGTFSESDVPRDQWVVWNDQNMDKKRSSEELFDYTDQNGLYGIQFAQPGDYFVRRRFDPDNTAGSPVGVWVTLDGVTPVTLDFSMHPPAGGTVTGVVFEDFQGDGVRDATDAPMEDRVVFVDENGNGTREEGEPFDRTNALGQYEIQGLEPGDHTVRIAGLPASLGYHRTTDNAVDITVVDDETVQIDFGQWIPLAFPGADGIAARVSGGRGGDVYIVTSLADDGPGTLREGVESHTSSTPRTIVFGIGGVIDLESRLRVKNDNLSILGQTAPGDGIVITGETFQIGGRNFPVENVILRHLSLRPGDFPNGNPDTHDGLAISHADDVIVDHVSVSWSIDELLGIDSSNNVTIQWSIFSEALQFAQHSQGRHGYGPLISNSGTISFHHNLLAHIDHRMPKIRNADIDVTNNVFYDWAQRVPTQTGGGNMPDPPSQLNLINNTYVAGPSVVGVDHPANIVFKGEVDSGGTSEVYLSGNVVDSDWMDGQVNATEPIGISDANLATFVEQPFQFTRLSISDTAQSYNDVLTTAGARTGRGVIDARIVSHVQAQTGGMISSEAEVGGVNHFRTCQSTLVDTDQDGMPDNWENANAHLNPNNAADRNWDIDGDGVTNLEDYFATLVTRPTGSCPIDPFVISPPVDSDIVQDAAGADSGLRPEPLPGAETAQPLSHSDLATPNRNREFTAPRWVSVNRIDAVWNSSESSEDKEGSGRAEALQLWWDAVLCPTV